MKKVCYPVRFIILFLLVTASGIIPQPLLAQPANDPSTNAVANSDEDRLPFMQNDQQTNKRDQPSTIGLLIRTLGALSLIVGLIVAASWGMRRFGGTHFTKNNEIASIVKVISTIPLGDRRSLMLVRFKDRTLLVGSTPQTLSLLAEDYEEPTNAPIRSVADILKESDSFTDEINSANHRLKQQES
jgi:flagellar biosynthetic protein FliO